MTALTLRRRILSRIEGIEDKVLLEEIAQLLELRAEEGRVIKLTKEQKLAIQQAQREFDEGKGIPHSKVVRDVEKWLQQKQI